jgi:hypothetical protein
MSGEGVMRFDSVVSEVVSDDEFKAAIERAGPLTLDFICAYRERDALTMVESLRGLHEAYGEMVSVLEAALMRHAP